MSFKEPIPALSNVMDTNEHASSRAERGVRQGCGVGLVTGCRSLEVPGPGAVAHMSLHQKPTMSKSHPTKEADNDWAPIYTGGPVVHLCWRPLRSEPVETVSAASVRGHLGGVRDSVNAFLQFCFAFSRNPQKSAVFEANFLAGPSAPRGRIRRRAPRFSDSDPNPAPARHRFRSNPAGARPESLSVAPRTANLHLSRLTPRS